jgi:hypothetical protein
MAIARLGDLTGALSLPSFSSLLGGYVGLKNPAGVHESVLQ